MIIQSILLGNVSKRKKNKKKEEEEIKERRNKKNHRLDKSLDSKRSEVAKKIVAI